jgi:hypothetical protein
LVAFGYKLWSGVVKLIPAGGYPAVKAVDDEAVGKIDLTPTDSRSMADDNARLKRFVSGTIRTVGTQLSEAKRAYTDGKRAAMAGLPRDHDGRARIVCRRHADRRAVSLDEQGRPACFAPAHPDCQGCIEDIDDGTIETW